MKLYRKESYNEKYDAQRNLEGRTHYVDDDTLRFFKARINMAGVAYEGLIYWIVESSAIDSDNTKRGHRFVAFDVYGNVLNKGDYCKSTDAARKQKNDFLAKIDAIKITQEAIERKKKQNECDFDFLNQQLERLKK